MDIPGTGLSQSPFETPKSERGLESAGPGAGKYGNSFCENCGRNCGCLTARDESLPMDAFSRATRLPGRRAMITGGGLVLRFRGGESRTYTLSWGVLDYMRNGAPGLISGFLARRGTTVSFHMILTEVPPGTSRSTFQKLSRIGALIFQESPPEPVP